MVIVLKSPECLLESEIERQTRIVNFMEQIMRIRRLDSDGFEKSILMTYGLEIETFFQGINNINFCVRVL